MTVEQQCGLGSAELWHWVGLSHLCSCSHGAGAGWSRMASLQRPGGLAGLGHLFSPRSVTLLAGWAMLHSEAVAGQRSDSENCRPRPVLGILTSLWPHSTGQSKPHGHPHSVGRKRPPPRGRCIQISRKGVCTQGGEKLLQSFFDASQAPTGGQVSPEATGAHEGQNGPVSWLLISR